MCKSLEQIIEDSSDRLTNGDTILVLFEDGVGTIFSEVGPAGKRIITLLDETPHRVAGSITQYRV